VVLHPRPEESAATIVELLPRKTKFSRKVAGRKSEEQVVAANVDVVFIVSGLDHDFNPRRIERYLVLARQSGADAVVLLNKADLRNDSESIRKEIAVIAGDIPVVMTSALKDEGLEVIANHLQSGRTGALLGSSGVGKTTIINHLLGSARKTAEVRENDSRGRHTTTVRELILLPSGGLLIDTPGMRELQLWGDLESVNETFEDIEALEQQCKFRDCSHDTEPGCEVRAALEQGTLTPERYESYLKLLRELAYQNRKNNEAEQRKEKERLKKRTMQYRKQTKGRQKRS
jgi:ribosome biogenesis GTPase